MSRPIIAVCYRRRHHRSRRRVSARFQLCIASRRSRCHISRCHIPDCSLTARHIIPTPPGVPGASGCSESLPSSAPVSPSLSLPLMGAYWNSASCSTACINSFNSPVSIVRLRCRVVRRMVQRASQRVTARQRRAWKSRSYAIPSRWS
jgi:hypothetical protein